jgi:DNA-binding PadR family transcriptional regulator
VGRNRSAVLELAVLGLLHRTPMHGYELRKQLTSVLGLFRALSYGSLYPCLHELLAAGLIAEEHDEAEPARTTAAGRPRPGRRALKVYRLTAEGKERLRILEGRRSRLEERMESIRAALTRTRERVDSYTLELHRHGLESVEREVRWLNELIASERQAGGPENTSDKESS